MVHFSASKPDSFPLAASHSSERATARVGLLEGEQDSFVLGGNLPTDLPRKVDFSCSTSDSALDEPFIETDLPTKVNHEELCTAHAGPPHAVRDTCARSRSVLSVSVPVPQKTKASARKMVSSPKGFLFLVLVVVVSDDDYARRPELFIFYYYYFFLNKKMSS